MKIKKCSVLNGATWMIIWYYKCKFMIIAITTGSHKISKCVCCILFVQALHAVFNLFSNNIKQTAGQQSKAARLCDQPLSSSFICGLKLLCQIWWRHLSTTKLKDFKLLTACNRFELIPGSSIIMKMLFYYLKFSKYIIMLSQYKLNALHVKNPV